MVKWQRDAHRRVRIHGHDGGNARLCLHHHPELLPLPRIREIVDATGRR